ncbi:MAG: putative porin [Pseudomonadales bacterium]|nr:putative porin [Pseudomonadales bacterium]
MKNISLFSLCLYLITITPMAHATITDQDFESLRTDLLSLLARVKALEKENLVLRIQKVKNSKPFEQTRMQVSETLPSKEAVKWKGDLSYRYEGIQVEGTDDRSRNRIRARIALQAKLKNNVEVGFRLASGGDNPVSTNQSLGDGGSSKDIKLDLAYFNWKTNHSVNLIAGKFKNIWARPDNNELIWDSDYNPEGFALTYKHKNLFLNSALNWLQSDSKKKNTRFSWGIQGGVNTQLAGAKLKTGISYYNLSVKDRGVFIGDNDEFAGNSFTCVDPTNLIDCTYDNDYEVLEVLAEFKTELNGLPVIVFGDYLQNIAADNLDTAWAAGIKLGKASGRGSWDLAYRYQSIEADSLLGLTTNSDFAGGGTDGKGHIFRGSFAINNQWKLRFTYFNNKRNGDLGQEEDYDRIQIDTRLSF